VNKGKVLAEVTNTIPTGNSVGENPLKLIVIYTGVTDKELAVMSSDDSLNLTADFEFANLFTVNSMYNTDLNVFLQK
jgi:hypothetical protein